jgi:hypothetical protein
MWYIRCASIDRFYRCIEEQSSLAALLEEVIPCRQRIGLAAPLTVQAFTEQVAISGDVNVP